MLTLDECYVRAASDHMMPGPGAAKSKDKKVGELSSEDIPDWVLLTAVFCGFIGMLLLGISVSKK